MNYSRETISDLYEFVESDWSFRTVKDGENDRELWVLRVDGKREDGTSHSAYIGTTKVGSMSEEGAERRCRFAISLDALVYAARTNRVATDRGLKPICRDELLEDSSSKDCIAGAVN